MDETPNSSDPEFIWGASAIQKALGLKTRRRAYEALETGKIVGARKVGESEKGKGGVWCLHLPTFRQSFTNATEAA